MTMKSRHGSRAEINGSLKSVFMAMEIHKVKFIVLDLMAHETAIEVRS